MFTPINNLIKLYQFIKNLKHIEYEKISEHKQVFRLMRADEPLVFNTQTKTAYNGLYKCTYLD